VVNLSDAKGAEQWVPSDPGYDFFFAGNDAGLRATQKFVTTEHYYRNAGFDALPD